MHFILNHPAVFFVYSSEDTALLWGCVIDLRTAGRSDSATALQECSAGPASSYENEKPLIYFRKIVLHFKLLCYVATVAYSSKYPLLLSGMLMTCTKKLDVFSIPIISSSAIRSHSLSFCNYAYYRWADMRSMQSQEVREWVQIPNDTGKFQVE